MNAASPGTSEVFRGMSVEGPPVRLHRLGVRAARVSDHSAQPDGEGARVERERAFTEGLQLGREEGLRSGYEDGVRRGREEASAQSAQLRDEERAELQALQEARMRLAAVAHALEKTADDWLAAAEDEMVCLCFEAVCRLAGDWVARPDAVRAQLAHLLQRAGPLVDVELHVHPQDFAVLAFDAGQAKTAAAAQPQSKPQAQPTWVADADIALGGCIVHRRGGGLDLRLETMLSECMHALLEARAHRASPATAADAEAMP